MGRGTVDKRDRISQRHKAYPHADYLSPSSGDRAGDHGDGGIHKEAQVTVLSADHHQRSHFVHFPADTSDLLVYG